MTLNKSGRKPFGTRVMVKMKTIGIKKDGCHYENGGFLIIPDDQWERRQLNEVIGQIVEIGSNAWYDITDPPKEGDYVIIKRYAGVHIEGEDGESYRSVIDLDVHTITNSDKDVEVISI